MKKLSLKIDVSATVALPCPLRKVAPDFGSLTIPTCAVQMMVPACVKAEAAVIRVPVLVGVGECDTCPHPLAEPSAYSAAGYVSVYIVPQMAHVHDFASTRQHLWNRLVQWSRTVAAE